MDNWFDVQYAKIFSQGKDDVTGEPLSQREDDKPEVVQKRLQDYATKTEPVVRFYREIGILKDFHGNTTDEMWPEIRKCIAQYFWILDQFFLDKSI